MTPSASWPPIVAGKVFTRPNPPAPRTCRATGTEHTDHVLVLHRQGAYCTHIATTAPVLSRPRAESPVIRSHPRAGLGD